MMIGSTSRAGFVPLPFVLFFLPCNIVDAHGKCYENQSQAGAWLWPRVQKKKDAKRATQNTRVPGSGVRGPRGPRSGACERSGRVGAERGAPGKYPGA
jgi:hypothetical protein